MAQASAADRLAPAPAPGARTWRLHLARFRWLDVLIVAELVAIVAVGVLVITRYAVWGPVDEGAHYVYVQQIVEQRSLPVLGESPTTPQAVAISHGISPEGYTVDTRTLGLAGLSYEAFQPPLYYLAAAPVFAAVPGYLNKVYALRAFDLALLLVAAGLAAILCKDVLGRRWRQGYALVLAVLLLPQIVVNTVPISNAALTLPLAIAFFIVVLRAVSRPSWQRLLASGVLLAACALTEVQMAVLAVVFLVAVGRFVWSRQPSPRHLGIAAGLTLVPLALVSPWLAFNEVHFHALTAEAVALQLQNPFMNPQHVHYSLRSLPQLTLTLGDVLLPQDWNTPLFKHGSWIMLDEIDKVLFFPVFGATILIAARRLLRRPAALLAIPIFAVTAVLWWITYVGQFEVINARYIDWALPEWVLLGGTALLLLSSRRLVAGLATGVAAVSTLTWVLMARAFLF